MSNLKQYREQAGLSQSQLAQISGVNVRMIQHYEQGFKDINKASAITVYKLAKALNIGTEDLIEMDKI
ncbi:helix-turn-helix domain-containing protein [uncultured Ruminococcus sp.]|uniref:helix-turn-helix domain-containing protein n=1 Tax=uncultured Ruminococcus sp. TaxID=165186 RepID=UPI0025DAB58C|nr:helix-turn-helix transcriptional regulator [uncultured Ruminococcus sp.]